MSRFADADDVRTVPLGPCECVGKPHAQDEAVVHLQLGYGAKGAINNAGWIAGMGIVFDGMAARRKLVELGVVSWNLLGNDGKPMPPTPTAIAQLDEQTIDAIAEALDSAIARETLPNDDGAPSADSSSESASLTLETPASTDSTTP